MNLRYKNPLYKVIYNLVLILSSYFHVRSARKNNFTFTLLGKKISERRKQQEEQEGEKPKATQSSSTSIFLTQQQKRIRFKIDIDSIVDGLLDSGVFDNEGLSASGEEASKTVRKVEISFSIFNVQFLFLLHLG